jgi:glyoxylase-like metal-dependent hydrolase (beta-lactamase superfamily II)
VQPADHGPAGAVALPAGVHVLERGWLSSNNVVFIGDESTALVDSGYSKHAPQTVALVDALLEGRPLDLLLNTHLHSDHCGGNSALQQRHPAVRTLIPPGQAAAVAAWDPVALTFEPTGQTCSRFAFQGLLQPGGEIQLGDHLWEVHAAPGHDPHSVVLFDPRSSVLISADALWERGFGIVFPELEGVQSGLDGAHAFDEVEATLNLIEKLAPRLVIPGHGSPFSAVSSALADAHARLAAYRADPRRHAMHAMKVLLKFKLLELEQVSWTEFQAWTRRTSYFSHVHARWFGELEFGAWLGALAADLVRSGAMRRDGERLLNG